MYWRLAKDQNNRIVYVLGIYRPPELNHCDKFFMNLTEMLAFLTQDNVKIVMVGDFNIDILKSYEIRKTFCNILENFKLEYLVKEPTRVTSDTKTCIDNVLL